MLRFVYPNVLTQYTSRSASSILTSKAAATNDEPGLGSAESEAIFSECMGSTRPRVMRKMCGCANTRLWSCKCEPMSVMRIVPMWGRVRVGHCNAMHRQ